MGGIKTEIYKRIGMMEFLPSVDSALFCPTALSQRSDNTVVFPGFCDVHVHFREPGFSYKEKIATGSAAAARGGYTTVCTMPNLNPVPDSVEHLREQLAIIERDAVIDVLPYGAITVGERGEQLADLEGMAKDVVAFSDDGRGVQEEDMMREAMRRAKTLGKLIVAHCEDNSLLHGGYIHDGIYAKADYISINVPYTDQTFHMLDARAFSKMKDGVRIINESRAEIVDDDAMLAALASGRVGKYVTDFPNEKVVGVENIIALPHLGACTPESEEKSAVMAARELYDYLANGNIKNSVNFPDATLERMGVSRVCILHQNVPTMLNQFLEITCSTGLNVENMINKAYGAYAYAMIDLNGRLDADQVAKIDRIPEVIRVRVV